MIMGAHQTDFCGHKMASTNPQAPIEHASHNVHTMARPPNPTPEPTDPIHSSMPPNPIPHASNTSAAWGISVKKTQGKAGNDPVAMARCGTTK
jgi:hypothetical protein